MKLAGPVLDANNSVSQSGGVEKVGDFFTRQIPKEGQAIVRNFFCCNGFQ